MGMMTAPTGETFYVPDGMFEGPAALPDLPTVGASLPSAPIAFDPIHAAPPLDTSVAQPAPPNLQLQTPGDINTSPARPDYNIGTLQAKGGKLVPGPAPAAPSSQAPAPKPPNDIQQAENEQIGGLAEQQRAALEQGQNQKQAADEQAYELEKRNRNVAFFAQQQADAEKLRQTEIASRQKQYDDAVNAFATKKIDPQRQWNNTGTGQKVLAGISVALSGIGQALMGKGGTNPALDVIQNAIKEDVASQVRDREGMKEVAGIKRTSLDDYMAQTKSARDAEQLKIAEEYKRTADQIQTIAQRHQGTDIAAHAADLAGKLRQQAGTIVGAAGEQAYNRTVKTQELANQRSQIGIAAGHLDLARKAQTEQTREFDLNYGKQIDEFILSKQAAGDAKAAKQAENARKLGIFDTSSGHAIVDEEGQKRLQQADQLEAQARRSQPDQAAKLNAQAQAIRTDANITNAALAPDEETARKIRPILIPSQTVLDQIQKAKDFLNSDPSISDRAGWSRVGTDIGLAMADWTQTKDMKFTNREAQALDEHVFHFNPDSLLSREFDRGKALASLDAVEKSVKGSVDATLKGNGITGNWVPRSAGDSTQQTFGGKTSQEAGGDAETSAIGKIGRALSSRPAIGDPTVGAENAAPSGPTGLSPADTGAVRELSKRYNAAGNQEAAGIVNSLAAPISGGNRESLSNGIIGLVRAENPTLYKAVIKALPPMLGAEVEASDPANVIGPKAPGAPLHPAVRKYIEDYNAGRVR